MLLAYWQVDEAVPAIFKALEDSDASVATDWRVDALIELHRAGKAVLPHAITAVGSDDKIICMRATRLLARLGPDASPAIDALMKKTLEGKLHASENCLWALKHIGTEEAVQAIVNCMNATGREVDTLLELHKNGKPVLSKVVQGLSNSKKSIRWGSATLLGLMGTDAESSTVALQKLLQDEDKEVRQAASGALLKINPSTSKVNN
ncbi:MAG: hypothetical protein JNJ77_05115 [Planctomycetia bacterium]|nr:hypothetical protein [Planctomycetia bacterium]